jgi:hypothetical protein
MMAQESAADMIDQLARAPEVVREAIGEINVEKLRNKPSASIFSPLEDVWHLRDIEAEGYLVRIRRILSELLPALEDLDGDRTAIERRYNELELEPAIAGFAVARGESVALLRGLPAEAWMRQARSIAA